MRQPVKECCASFLTAVLVVSLLPSSTDASRSVRRSLVPMEISTRLAGPSMSRSVPQAGGGLNASPPAHMPVPPVPPVQIASAQPQELPPPAGFVLLPGQARTLLPGGRILVTGGASKDGPVADAWLLDPANGLAAKLPAGLREARAFHTATILPDGAVLILGGVGADGLAATELFTRPRHSRSISCRYPG